MTAPPDAVIRMAEEQAALSPCEKSKRGVVLYASSRFSPHTVYGTGHNGPPGGAPCPGRVMCGGDCGRRCVHAEMRAIRGIAHPGFGLDMVHVKLGPDGRVIAGGPPSCWQCSREILDVDFVAGVWLYEAAIISGSPRWDGRNFVLPDAQPTWRYYTAADFHAVTLRNAGIAP